MAHRFNFGIDLGTTNSAIARLHQGEAELIRNPSGMRELMPSVVAKKGDRLMIGDKAREWMKRDPSRVFVAFKRKMGTTHTFYTPDGDTYSPEELSAMVLREMRQFLPVEKQPQASVITIPASFDSGQAQATIRAGELAGFQHIRLLQEPIAASLAFANKGQQEELLEGQWLVYDLGGGTFDVALVRIRKGEMTVVDHEGDNFLGGTDVDLSIVMKIILPALMEQGHFPDLAEEIRSGSGRYQGLLQKLMILAEEAKIELSAREETDIELDVEDQNGEWVDLVLTVSRDQLIPLLSPMVDRTIQQVKSVLKRNKLQANNLKTILLVGGTTYIPFVRESLANQLGIQVSIDVDPTTAVAAGAAFYAGTIEIPKQEAKKKPSEGKPASEEGITVRFGYQKVTKDLEEFVVAEIESYQPVDYYRFVRSDGGFDTGILPFEGKIRQYLTLLPGTVNEFSLRLYNQEQQEIPANLPNVSISQGHYAIQGQPLPMDICVEVDDLESRSTRLEVIFTRNTLLPVRKTITRQVSRSISAGSQDALTIKVLEGTGNGIPAAALPIGGIRIGGDQLNRDIVKGSDVEITLEMNESRVLKVEVYLMMTDQEIREVFVPEKRQVDLRVLREDLHRVMGNMRREIADSAHRDQPEMERSLTDLEYELIDLIDGARALKEDDVTDARFQIEDRMRKIAGELYRLTQGQELLRVKEAYFHQKRALESTMEEYEPSEDDRKNARELMAEEKLTLSSGSAHKVRLFTERVQNLAFQIQWRSSKFVRSLYLRLKLNPISIFSDPQKAESLFQTGDQAYESGNDHQLRITLNQLYDLLPRARQEESGFLGTGLG